MAPEYFEGKSCTEAVDIFAFGVRGLSCSLHANGQLCCSAMSRDDVFMQCKLLSGRRLSYGRWSHRRYLCEGAIAKSGTAKHIRHPEYCSACSMQGCSSGFAAA